MGKRSTEQAVGLITLSVFSFVAGMIVAIFEPIGVLLVIIGFGSGVWSIHFLNLPKQLITTTEESIILVKKDIKQNIEIKFEDIDSITAIEQYSRYGPKPYGALVVRTKRGTKYRQENISEVVATADALNKLLKDRQAYLSDI